MSLNEKIQQSFEIALGAILERLETAKSNNQPLVVFLGENHGAPSHILLHILLIQSLLERGVRLHIGVEHPHNTLHAFFMVSYIEPQLVMSEEAKEKRVFELKAQFSNVSTQDIITLNTFIHFADSPYSSTALYRYLAINSTKLTVSANDVARKGMGMRFSPLYETTQRAYAQAVERFGVTESLDKLTLHSHEGMTIRNLHMLNEIKETLTATDRPDIYLQITGQAHVSGQTDRDRDFLHAGTFIDISAQDGVSFLSLIYTNATTLNEEATSSPHILQLNVSENNNNKFGQPAARDFINQNVLNSEIAYLRSLAAPYPFLQEHLAKTRVNDPMAMRRVERMFEPWYDTYKVR